jgi:hypothetical protein
MSNTKRSVSRVKRSHTDTLFHETEALLKAANLQQAPQIILQLLQQLNGKLELHVHFTVNNINNGIGHILCGNNSEIIGTIQTVQTGSSNKVGNISQTVYK